MSRARTIAGIIGAGEKIDTSLYATLPVGAILPHAGTSPPSGYLLCSGQAVSRSTYAALFAVISTTYGTGDGSTTFNLPDLRGRVPGGKDDMGGTAAGRLTTAASGVNGAALGASGGAEAVTLTGAQSGTSAHSHTATPSLSTDSQGSHQHPIPGGAAAEYSTGLLLANGVPGGATNYTSAAGAHNHNVTGTVTVAAAAAANASQAHTNTQPTLVVNYMIRAA